MALKVTTFQNRFAALFDECDKTTTDLAKELHVSNQTISAWKNGTRSPKEPTVIAIANYFGVNVAWLLGFNVEKYALNLQIFAESYNPKTDEAKIISGGIDKMPPERREQALKIMQTIFAEYFNGSDDDGT